MKEKKAYILILTTEEFLPGLLVTYRSLREYSKEDVVVLINPSITETVEKALADMKMRVVRVNDIELPKGVLSEKMKKDRWCHTLFKLRVFGMTEYTSLIYLDSDLLICGQLDELFEKEGLTAVSDADFFPEYSRGGINAGVMAFRPSKELEQNLISMIPKVAEKMDIFGDQDVINAYFSSWEEDGQKLDVKYNACFYQLDSYNNVTPRVVHFILGSKPWMWSSGQIGLKYMKWLLKGKKLQCKYLRKYLQVQKS